MFQHQDSTLQKISLHKVRMLCVKEIVTKNKFYLVDHVMHWKINYIFIKYLFFSSLLHSLQLVNNCIFYFYCKSWFFPAAQSPTVNLIIHHLLHVLSMMLFI